jgi:phage gp29-like protein
VKHVVDGLHTDDLARWRNERDLAEFLEIYGLPVRLGKYPEGATEKEKSTLLQAVLSIGHNAGGIIPRGMEIEFQNAASGVAFSFSVAPSGYLPSRTGRP